MPYFERARRMSVICIVAGILLLIVSMILFQANNLMELLRDGFTNHLAGIFVALTIFLISIFTLTIGIALRRIVLDAKEDMMLIEKRIREEASSRR